MANELAGEEWAVKKSMCQTNWLNLLPIHNYIGFNYSKQNLQIKAELMFVNCLLVRVRGCIWEDLEIKKT